jgi:hypothetical protein
MRLLGRLFGRKDISSTLAIYNDLKKVVETTESLSDADPYKASAREKYSDFRFLARTLEAKLDKGNIQYERIRWPMV